MQCSTNNMEKKTFRVRECAVSPAEGSASAGDSILIAGSCALFGAQVIAERNRELIKQRFPGRTAARCLALYSENDPRLSSESIAEVQLPKTADVTSVCIPGDGGILAALWDLSVEAKTGFEADLRKIPLRQEVIEVCELVDVNPYRLHAKGCILFTARNGDAAKKALEDEGIPCTVIGWMDKTKGRKLHSGEILTYLDFPAPDELGRITLLQENPAADIE